MQRLASFSPLFTGAQATNWNMFFELAISFAYYWISVFCVTNKVPFKVSPVLANDFSYIIHHSSVLRQQHALFFKGHSLFSWSLWNPKSINLLSRSPFTDISQKIEKYSEGGGGTHLFDFWLHKEGKNMPLFQISHCFGCHRMGSSRGGFRSRETVRMNTITRTK